MEEKEETASVVTNREFIANSDETARQQGKMMASSEDLVLKVWQKRKEELISYNDCLYRNIRDSKFILPLDIDEIIVPKDFYDWRLFLDNLHQTSPDLFSEYASLSVRNSYFLKDFEETSERGSIFFFKYLKRSLFSPKWESGKSFILTDNSLTVFNHYVLEVLRPGIRRTYFLPVEKVQMNHYRQTCSVGLLPECIKYLTSPVRIVDTLILKYFAEFNMIYVKTVGRLKELGLL